jgi:hypothetical protein
MTIRKLDDNLTVEIYPPFLNVDKAVGHDIISNRMLLAVKNEIAKPLSLLFNRSIQILFSRSVENCTCHCLLISAKVILVICFLSNASEILS